ncbi:MAG: lysophospholipid acyltransferase family protein, partial [Hypericibacter sp.]
MRISRRLLASELIQVPLACFLALYIRIVGWTTRWQREGFGTLEALRAEGKPVIFCFWHGRLAMMPLCHREARAAAVLIST